MDELGDLNTHPRMDAVPGVTVQDAVVEKITQEIHYHPSGGREWCLTCDREVLKDERAFRCPRCGSAPHHEECCDKEMHCCPKCAREFRIEEQQRYAFPPLVLDLVHNATNKIEVPCRIFIFVRRTLQIGRAKPPDCQPCKPDAKRQYSPRTNDIVSRVVATLEDSRRAVHADRSRLISRAHGVLRIHRGSRGEELRYLDCGNDGRGSSHGSWIGKSKLEPARWHTLEQRECVKLGFDPRSGEAGFSFDTVTYRSPADPKLVAAVGIRRCDALSREHMYVMIGREAAMGAGPNICIPVRSGSPQLDGVLTWQSGQLFLELPSGSTLRIGNDVNPSEEIPFCPGLVLRGNDVSIHVREATDQDFCTF